MDDAPVPPRHDQNPPRGDADAPVSPRALAWVDTGAVAQSSAAVDIAQLTGPYRPAAPDLLARRPRRRVRPAAVWGPVAGAAALASVYATAALLWPLDHVQPTITAAAVGEVQAPASAVTWPVFGSAAVGVAGVDAVPSSATDFERMASLTKVVTALVVLDADPLQPGEPGPERRFTAEDRALYWQYLGRGESALDVPVGGTLSQVQLLQGMLIGSAGNYAHTLAVDRWPTDADFAAAANAFLASHDIDGITIVDPSGIGVGNVATPTALIEVAELAMADPVIADIVGTETVELPGAGVVENTNALIGDGATGLKTGTLYGGYNLLAADEVTVGDTPVEIFAAVLGQPSNALRFAETERLLTELAAELDAPAVVPEGTTVAEVQTLWGDRSDVVTAEPAEAAVWNGTVASASTDVALTGDRTAGGEAGTLTFAGPIDQDTVALILSDTIGEPDAWWRLTHPLELFGLR
ncbi:hypothetical protein [Microbacterium sp.]|uniref:hypothetical protein n=1 Tax=Microbacterium sp. TaxID=51671 RepID=UPI003A8BFCE9